ncbi:MAG: hypothetical protein Q6K80_12260 [Thermostichus sp. DG_1_6_bins_120]
MSDWLNFPEAGSQTNPRAGIPFALQKPGILWQQVQLNSTPTETPNF